MSLHVRRRRVPGLSRPASAFTLLEIFVVLGIIAMFLALLVPFFARLRQGGRSEACAENMRRIGKAIQAYAADNKDLLPGPLTIDQYPVDSAGNPPRDGQLLKYIARYLEAPSGSNKPSTARATFTFPAWQSAEHTTDSPVFTINNESLWPAGTPAWGSQDKPPLKMADLQNVSRKVGARNEPVNPAKLWALTEADQELANLLQINEPWVARTPEKPVHVTHRNALYFDMHVEPLVLARATGQATIDQDSSK